MSWCHIADTMTTARKEHRCHLCGESIGTGERYLRRTGITEGLGFGSFPMHVECEQATHDWDQSDWENYEPGTEPRPRRTQ
jgi:hypothetical protein